MELAPEIVVTVTLDDEEVSCSKQFIQSRSIPEVKTTTSQILEFLINEDTEDLELKDVLERVVITPTLTCGAFPVTILQDSSLDVDSKKEVKVVLEKYFPNPSVIEEKIPDVKVIEVKENEKLKMERSPVYLENTSDYKREVQSVRSRSRDGLDTFVKQYRKPRRNLTKKKITSKSSPSKFVAIYGSTIEELKRSRKDKPTSSQQEALPHKVENPQTHSEQTLFSISALVTKSAGLSSQCPSNSWQLSETSNITSSNSHMVPHIVELPPCSVQLYRLSDTDIREKQLSLNSRSMSSFSGSINQKNIYSQEDESDDLYSFSRSSKNPRKNNQIRVISPRSRTLSKGTRRTRTSANNKALYTNSNKVSVNRRLNYGHDRIVIGPVETFYSRKQKHDTDNSARSPRSQAEDSHYISRDFDQSIDDDLQMAIRNSQHDLIDTDKENQIDESAPFIAPRSGPTLTPEMIKKVDDAFNLEPETKIITQFTLTIKQSSLRLYRKLEWLEDPNVDFYLEMIRARNEEVRLQGSNYPRVYVFHSFFFSLISGNSKSINNFEVVKDTTVDNIFEYDMAFFPISIRDHWRLIVAHFKEKTLYCYDSMFRVNDAFLNTIEKYLEREYKAKFELMISRLETKVLVPDTTAAMSPESETEGNISDADTIPLTPLDEEPIGNVEADRKTLPVETEVVARRSIEIEPWEVYFEGWEKDTLDPDETHLPQQNNGSDCGIFLCQYAESLARGQKLPFDFTQRNMPYFRYLMAWETIVGRLFPRGVSIPFQSPSSP